MFDGTNHKPYVETDVPNPQSSYGRTKLDGELAMKKINPSNSIIIRTSWVYSSFGNNFVKAMLKLANTKKEISVVSDQIGSPTNAADLANFILNILSKINNENVEIFHYSNEGVCSWYDFAKAIFEIKGVSVVVNSLESKNYITNAKRPYYSLLNKNKVKKVYNCNTVHWKDSLIQFFLQ